MTSLELAKEAAKILDSKKALELKIVGIRDISVLTDYFVFASGTSNTHVKALADEVEFELKKIGVETSHIEGYRSNSWVLLDYGNVIVHVFTDESRKFYDLDHLWQDGEPIDISFLNTEE
jgi:ribosome-associated protein